MGQADYNCEKLTPDKDADLSVYEEANEFAFANLDITNVAISEAYNARKSSVIESYVDKSQFKNGRYDS